jgi:SAM-dependent methyltransferase
MPNIIAPTGFWTIDGRRFEQEHFFDEALGLALVDLARRENRVRAYDFGCGHGKYVALFRANGIEAIGFDGNPGTSKLAHCRVQDLTDLRFQEPAVPFVLCLEVGEHVPKAYETPLLANLDKHVASGGLLVLSWAVVGQAGLGHVNCQNNDSIVAKFKALGFSYDAADSQALRACSTLPWFKNTIMVFRKA